MTQLRHPLTSRRQVKVISSTEQCSRIRSMTTQGRRLQVGHRMLVLVTIFAKSMRIFGLFPYTYDNPRHIPQLSRGWRIYSGLCLTSYILVFTMFCTYVIIRSGDIDSADHLMDFVRIFEVLMIGVMLVAINVTEQCFYGPCSRVLIKMHRTLGDIFQDLHSSKDSSVSDWFFRRVVATTWKFLLRTVVLMIISASITYSKFISLLYYLPMGWNYIGMILLIIPFLAISLACTKVCVYVHAVDHAFQLLNQQIQLLVHQLNVIERSSSERRGGQQNPPHSRSISMPSLVPINVDNGSSVSHPVTRWWNTGNGSGRRYRKQKLMFELQQMIYHIRSQHDDLSVLVEEFFKAWALYNLLFLTMQFSLIVVEAFFLFTNVYASIRSGMDVDLDYALLNLRACFMVVIELTWTIGSCSNLMDSIQRIGVLLNALVMLDLDSGLVQTIETWTIKLLSQPNGVQVFQLFDINNGLLYSVSLRVFHVHLNPVGLVIVG